MSRVPPSLAAYIQSDHPLAESVNEGLEIRSRINIKIDVQIFGVWGLFLNGHAVFSK
jgi:hypothetical protein